MQLLRPLLMDKIESIQQSAALALGRLANVSKDVALQIVENQILPQLIDPLEKKNVSFLILYRDFISKPQPLR